MPAASPTMTEDEAVAYVRARTCMPCADPRVGVELEWLVHDCRDRSRILPLDEIADLVGGGFDGTVTFEPGGQVEISSRPHQCASAAVAATARDVELLRSRLGGAGFSLEGTGRDRWRAPVRTLSQPRYDAMERYFRHTGSIGAPTMMCATAAVQVNVALGSDPAEVSRRWRLAHRLGPVLAATFANSPLGPDGPTGWKSSRLAAWYTIDPSRTMPVESTVPPALSWPEYALAARVMLIRRHEHDHVAQLEPLTFREWVRHGHELGHPTVDDLAYHLTTLFPPVRPRGWLELRMLDALPAPWWPVPLHVVTALLDDPGVDTVVAGATGPVHGRWADAARYGLSDPDFAAAARACFDAAIERLADGAAAGLVADYAARYVQHGRTPADELLERRPETEYAAGVVP